MPTRRNLSAAFLNTVFSFIAVACFAPVTVIAQEAIIQDTIQDSRVEVVERPLGRVVFDASDFELEAMPLRSSFLATTFGRDLDKMRQTTVFKAAKNFGVDLPDDLNDVLIHRQRGSNHFYLFHNTLRTEIPCAYFVQRIHKRISNYTAADDEPEVTDHYLVEAIKSSGGQLKKPDQHYASYSLKKFKRRVIEKTLEIGEVVNEKDASLTAPWPYATNKLSEIIQDYGSSREKYDTVNFKRAIRWTIRVEMNDEGAFSLQVPKLGINIQRQTPVMANGAQLLDQRPERVELIAGEGLNIVRLGSSEELVNDLLGAALRVDATETVRTLTYDPGIRMQFFRDRLVSISVLGDFPGKTCEGIKLGDSKQDIGDLFGEAIKSTDETDVFDGIGFQYKDGLIVAITTVKRRPQPKVEVEPKQEAQPVGEAK